MQVPRIKKNRLMSLPHITGSIFDKDKIEKIKLKEHDVNFLMAIETGGMFDRLVENGFDEEYKRPYPSKGAACAFYS